MAHLHMHTVFEGALARVVDVRCEAPPSPAGAEEASPWHQVIFTRSGAFVKHAGAGARRQVVAEPLHVLCLNQGEVYRISHPAPGGDDCTLISFSPDAIREVAVAVDQRTAEDPERPIRITHAPLAPDLLLRFRALRRSSHDPLAAEDKALALLRTVLERGYHAHGAARSGRRDGTARRHRELSEQVKEALAARPGHPRSLSALAREVHSSPYHLTRIFREQVGLPVHRYLLNLRLATALEHVEAGETDLSALAHSLGFSSHSHFSEAFRRTFGRPPSRLVPELADRATPPGATQEEP
jgi:AraC family transcriptional regulator